MSSLTVRDYHIGWICALQKEMAAAMAMLDEKHPMIAGQDQQDHNAYVLGRIHQHNVVIACMPAGVDGLVSAAVVSRNLARTFPGLRFGLMVGIGGGIPDLVNGVDIRLGDVVVSMPDKTWGGVVQYDHGKAESEGVFVRTWQLNQPPELLLRTLTQVQVRHELQPNKITKYVMEAVAKSSILEEKGYVRPDSPDQLWCPSCNETVDSAAGICDGPHQQRLERIPSAPIIHYGIVASGNMVVKDAVLRDRLRDEFGALCVEREAAGLMDNFPCLVIRGICDYADHHKNDSWHGYAAITAAAYAKEFLFYLSPMQTSQEQPIREILGILDEVQQTTQAQEQVLQAQVQYFANDEHRRCHQAFNTSNYELHKDVNPDRVEGTCQWVLTHDQYRRWHDSDGSSLLWISADPGCGKSVLARSLVDRELRGSETHSICYFFFKDNEEQDNVATALCAILHQLLAQQPQLIHHVLAIYDPSKPEQVQQDVEQLWRVLLTAANDADAQDVTCVLDALDECRPQDRSKLINMLARFHKLAQRQHNITHTARLKFLVTSRPYDDIRDDFERTLRGFPIIQLRGEEENDRIRAEIDLMIKIRIKELSLNLRLSKLVRDQLQDKLLSMKHRTYLWLNLALDSIKEALRNSHRPQLESVEQLPSSVEAAYEKILSKVSSDQRAYAQDILRIVVGSRRPLTVQEMAIAFGIVDSRGRGVTSLKDARLDPEWVRVTLRRWCGLFIFFNHDRIYLIHQTAKEFLLADVRGCVPSSGWKHCLNPGETEIQMAQICTNLLSFEDTRTTTKDIATRCQKRNPIDTVLNQNNEIETLVAYAAEYWPSHFRAAQNVVDEGYMDELASFYDVTGGLQRLWFPIYWRATNPYEDQPHINALQLAGLLGHAQQVARIIQSTRWYGIDDVDQDGNTALIWACRYGHKTVVQMLLDTGAYVNAQGGQFGNALQAASAGGHEQVVLMLLDKGADINAQGGQFGNALQAASQSGYKAMVQMLLDKGAYVNAQGGQFGNALQAASAGGHEQVVLMLLDKGVDVNAQGGQFGNALQAASAGGHEQVVLMLLDKGVDINAQGGQFGNALQAASAGGHEQVVLMLLDKGADVNAQGGQSGNALQAASAGGHPQVVQMLLKGGANMNAQERDIYIHGLRAFSSRSSRYSSGWSSTRDAGSTLPTSMAAPNLPSKHAPNQLDTPVVDTQQDQPQEDLDAISIRSGVSAVDLLGNEAQDIAQRFATALIKEQPDRSLLIQGNMLSNPSLQRSLQQYIKEYTLQVRFAKPPPDVATAANTIRASRQIIYRLFVDELEGSSPIALFGNAEKMNLRQISNHESVKNWLGVSGLHDLDNKDFNELSSNLQKGNNNKVASEPDATGRSDSSDSSMPESHRSNAARVHVDTLSDRMVENFLLEHEAFNELVEKTRGLVERECCDQREVIRQRVLLGLKSQHVFSHEKLTATFCTRTWDVRSYLHHSFRNGFQQDLERTIAITGDADKAYFSSVQAYLERFWPECSSELLDGIRVALKGAQISKPGKHQKHRVTIDLDARTVQVDGTEDFIVAMAQQLAWLVAGCRASNHGLQHSHVAVRHNLDSSANAHAVFELTHELADIDPATKKSCWNELVGNSAIVRGFPIPDRSLEQHGLELTFELMAALGNIPVAVEYAGGYVLKGRSVLFYPVRRKESWVQWHAKTVPHGRIRYDDIDSTQGLERLTSKSLSMKAITSTRVFLGWTPEAVNSLGTKSYQYQDVDYSKTGPPSNHELSIQGGTIGFSYFGVLQTNIAFGRHNGPHNSGLDTDFYDQLLDDAGALHVILKDAGALAGRAWLVDGESAILHLILHRARLGKYDQGMGQHLQYATAGNVVTVRRSMIANSDVVLTSKRRTADGDVTSLYFRHVVRELFTVLEGLQAFSRQYSNSEGVRIGKTWRECIHGFEYMQIWHRRRKIHFKEAQLEKTSGRWPTLARESDTIVLFGKGFGEVIEPAKSLGLCTVYRTAPRGHDYLVAEIRRLERLFEESGSREDYSQLTSTGLQWHMASDSFAACPHQGLQSADCRCAKIQHLYPKGTFGSINLPRVLPLSGAVIFGQQGLALAKTAKSFKPHQLFKSHSQQKKPLQPQERDEMRLYNPETANSSQTDYVLRPKIPVSDVTVQDAKHASQVHGLQLLSTADSELLSLSSNETVSRASNFASSVATPNNESSHTSYQLPDYQCTRSAVQPLHHVAQGQGLMHMPTALTGPAHDQMQHRKPFGDCTPHRGKAVMASARDSSSPSLTTAHATSSPPMIEPKLRRKSHLPGC